MRCSRLWLPASPYLLRPCSRAAYSLSQPVVLLAWLHVYQPNKLASATAPCVALGSGFLLRPTSSILGLVPPASVQSWGGARDGGKRRAAWQASWRSRWLRIFGNRSCVALPPASMQSSRSPQDLLGNCSCIALPPASLQSDAGDDVHGSTNVAGGRMPGATILT